MIINSFGLALSAACKRCPFAVLLTDIIFTAFPPVAFPPLTLAIIGVAPEPGGLGGGWLLPCETSMGWLSPWLGFPLTLNCVSFATYDWSDINVEVGPRWFAIISWMSTFFLHGCLLMFC